MAARLPLRTESAKHSRSRSRTSVPGVPRNACSTSRAAVFRALGTKRQPGRHVQTRRANEATPGEPTLVSACVPLWGLGKRARRLKSRRKYYYIQGLKVAL